MLGGINFIRNLQKKTTKSDFKWKFKILGDSHMLTPLVIQCYNTCYILIWQDIAFFVLFEIGSVIKEEIFDIIVIQTKCTLHQLRQTWLFESGELKMKLTYQYMQMIWSYWWSVKQWNIRWPINYHIVMYI